MCRPALSLAQMVLWRQDPVQFVPRLRREVCLDPDHRRDTRVLGVPVELGGPEQVAVIGHRHVRHALALDLRHQVLQPGGTVQHGVLGMHMQVGERLTRSRHDEPPPQGTLLSTHSPAEASLWTAGVVINPVLTSLVEGRRCRRVAAPARSGWSLMSVSGISNMYLMIMPGCDIPGAGAVVPT